MKPIKLLIALLLAAGPSPLRAQTDTTVFSLLDLARPGLERVAALHAAGDDTAAAEALLDYYRRRTGVVCPEANLADITITPDEQRWADEALDHQLLRPQGLPALLFLRRRHRLALLAREGQRTALAAAPPLLVHPAGQVLLRHPATPDTSTHGWSRVRRLGEEKPAGRRRKAERPQELRRPRSPPKRRTSASHGVRWRPDAVCRTC